MPPPLSIVFCGTPDFAAPSLRALIEDPRFRVTLVVTQPDKPVGRAQVLTPPPVKVVAGKHQIPVAQPEDIASFWNQELKTNNQKPDFLVVVAYGQILPEELLAWPSRAAVNAHASLLPRWRGASPIAHAILAGDRETGVTIQQMVKDLDAGPILAQKKTAIGPRETAADLSGRLATMAAELLVETLTRPLSPLPQDPSQVTICRKLSRKDGEVSPAAMTAEEIDRRVRALVPWPGIRCDVYGEPVKLLVTALEPQVDPLALPCKNGTTLYVRKLQSPGGKPLSGTDWQRGRRKTT